MAAHHKHHSHSRHEGHLSARQFGGVYGGPASLYDGLTAQDGMGVPDADDSPAGAITGAPAGDAGAATSSA